MSLKDKYSKKSSTQKTFIGRKQYLSIFKDALKDTSQLQVVNFYGIGGIGKSSLSQECMSYLDNRYIKIAINLQKDINTLNNIIHISTQLKEQKVNCLFFLLAYNLYWSKLNPTSVSREQEILFENTLGTVGDILDTFGEVAEASLVTPGIKLIKKYIKKHSIQEKMKKYDSLVLERFNEFEEENYENIEEELIFFLAADVKYFQEKNPTRLVFSIDTYENLFKSTSNDVLGPDRWVRHFALELENPLLLITGRDVLHWEREDEEWNTYLNQYILSEFTRAEAINYLKFYKVVDSQAIDAILTASNMHPFYISLLVFHYKQGESLENLTKLSHKELLNRFVYLMPTKEKDTLEVLCIAKSYDDALFLHLVKAFSTGYSGTKAEEFSQKSYIQKVENRYHIHNLMQEHISQNLSQSLVLAIHKEIASFYNLEVVQLLENNSSYSQISDLFDALKNMYLHKLVYQTEEAWFIEFKEDENTNKVLHSKAYSKLVMLFESLYDVISSASIRTYILLQLVPYYQKLRQNEKAKSLIQQLKDEYILPSQLSEYYMIQSETASSRKDKLYFLKAAEKYTLDATKKLLIISDIMNIHRKANRSLNRIKEIEHGLATLNLDVKVRIKLLTDISLNYVQKEDYEDAFEVLNEAQVLIKKTYSNGHVTQADVSRNMANIYFLQKDYAKTYEHILQAFSIYNSYQDDLLNKKQHCYTLFAKLILHSDYECTDFNGVDILELYILILYESIDKLHCSKEKIEELLKDYQLYNNDKVTLAKLLSAVARNYDKNQEFKYAEEFELKSLALRVEIPDVYFCFPSYKTLLYQNIKKCHFEKCEMYLTYILKLAKYTTAQIQEVNSMLVQLSKLYANKKMQNAQERTLFKRIDFVQNNGQKQLDQAYNEVGRFFSNIDAAKAHEYYKKALTFALANNNVTPARHGYNNMIILYKKQMNYDAYETVCLERYNYLKEELKNNLEKVNNTLEGKTIKNAALELRDYYIRTNVYVKAEDILFDMIKYFTISYPSDIWRDLSYGYIMEFYEQNNQQDKAEPYYLKQIEIRKFYGPSRTLAKAYYFYGSFLLKINKHDERAIVNFKKYFEIFFEAKEGYKSYFFGDYEKFDKLCVKFNLQDLLLEMGIYALKKLRLKKDYNNLFLLLRSLYSSRVLRLNKNNLYIENITYLLDNKQDLLVATELLYAYSYSFKHINSDLVREILNEQKDMLLKMDSEEIKIYFDKKLKYYNEKNFLNNKFLIRKCLETAMHVFNLIDNKPLYIEYKLKMYDKRLGAVNDLPALLTIESDLKLDVENQFYLLQLYRIIYDTYENDKNINGATIYLKKQIEVLSSSPSEERLEILQDKLLKLEDQRP